MRLITARDLDADIRLGSETILKFLYDHVDKSGDLQARVKWQPGTVVLWDNRVTAHVS